MIKIIEYIFCYNILLFCYNNMIDSGIINNEVNDIIIPVNEFNDNIIIPVDEIVLNNETIKPITGNKNLFLRVFLIFVVIIVVVLLNYFKEINKKKEIQKLTQDAKDFIKELKKEVKKIKKKIKAQNTTLSEDKKSQLTIKDNKSSHYDKEGIPCKYNWSIGFESIGFYYEYVESNSKIQYYDTNFYPVYIVNFTKIYYDEKNKIIYDENFKKTDDYDISISFIDKKNHNKISTSSVQQEDTLSESFQTKLKNGDEEIKKLVDNLQKSNTGERKKRREDVIKNKDLDLIKDGNFSHYIYKYIYKDGMHSSLYDYYYDTDHREVFHDKRLKLFYYEYKDKNNKYRYCDTNFYPFYEAYYNWSLIARVYYDEENNTIYIYNEKGKFIKTEDYEVAFMFIKKKKLINPYFSKKIIYCCFVIMLYLLVLFEMI
jgi:uncharacterized protein YqkB